MSHTTLQTACLLAALSTAPLLAQERLAPDVAPPPDARTFAEEISPTTFGLTVNPAADGRLTVSRVMDGSAAGTAGLVTGDTIVSVDGQFITQADELHEYLAAHSTAPLRIVIVREGTERTLVVNASPAASVPAEQLPADTVEARPALGVRFLQGQQVILGETLAGSPAELAGLEVGDHLVAVNGDVIESTDHFISLVAATPTDAALDITYVRGRDRHTVAITPVAWNAVFGAAGTHVTLRPDLTDVETTPATCVAAPYYYAPAYYAPAYYVSNVSPVIVPLTAYTSWPYGYSYWNYPYYSYPSYSHYGYPIGPYYNYAWPYGPPRERPIPIPSTKQEVDSAQRIPPAADRQIERASVSAQVVD